MSSNKLQVLRIMQYVTRKTSHLIHQNLDILISLLLFATALYAYTATLAPTVIEGDAALFQYTPYVLGVTYPTGFPLYILLGKLWVTLFPFGEIAWRMNLFSALCSAVALPLVYNATRRLFSISNPQSPMAHLPITHYPSLPRYAALAAVLLFATLPTFWRWSTEAKTYGLNILLFGSCLYLLAYAIEARASRARVSPSSHTFMTPLQALRLSLLAKFRAYPLAGPFLLLGLFISVHNTGVLLVPGLLAMAWLYFPQQFRRPKSILLHLLILAAPGLFYLYVPLRAEWLIANVGRQSAIEQGLLADFYRSGLNGWIGYFTGAGFTEGVVSNWGRVPAQFFTVYLPLLIEDATVLGVGLGLVGGVALAAGNFRLFVPLFLWYAVPIPFVIVYGRGQQSAFLLPSFLIFSLFAGYTLMLIPQLITAIVSYLSKLYSPPLTPYVLRITNYALRLTPPLLLGLLTLYQLLPQIQHNSLWLSVKWNRDIYNEWETVLNHPLEPEAGILAHWGDLTPFWYMQHAENRRPDLHGVYPPDETIVIDWFRRGSSDLYIAGPLQGWAGGIEERYQLIPWGRLVRIAPRQADPQQIMPALTQEIGATFGNKLQLQRAGYAPPAVSGRDFPVALSWRALVELPPEVTISLRLTQNGLIVAQLDERLRSGWFPRDSLAAGQHVLSYSLLPVPLGTLPGPSRLQLVVYTNQKQPWTLPDGPVVLDLGPVEIVPFPANQRPDTGPLKPLPAHTFSDEIRLVGYSYSVARVGQGKGFAVRLLWQATTNPANNYSLLVEQLDAGGNVLRANRFQPVEGRAPTASWQPGQFVRDLVDLVVPASAPPGEEALRVRLSWLRPDGSRLSLKRWGLPLDDGLVLDWLTVTEKEGRLFEPPPMQHPLPTDLEGKVKLLGFDTVGPTAPGLHLFQIDQAACSAKNEGCRIGINFYWQGVSPMEQPYKRFFHIVDAQGQIIAQHDRAPGDRGKQPTTGWLPGEVVTDPIALQLPAGVAAGQYTIWLGMYLPPTGPRLQVLADGQPAGDFIEVGTVTVTAK